MVVCSELEFEIDTGLLVLLNEHKGKYNLETKHDKPFNQSFSTSAVESITHALIVIVSPSSYC